MRAVENPEARKKEYAHYPSLMNTSVPVPSTSTSTSIVRRACRAIPWVAARRAIDRSITQHPALFCVDDAAIVNSARHFSPLKPQKGLTLMKYAQVYRLAALLCLVSKFWIRTWYLVVGRWWLQVAVFVCHSQHSLSSRIRGKGHPFRISGMTKKKTIKKSIQENHASRFMMPSVDKKRDIRK